MRGDLFLGYARHMTELDTIANRIYEAYRQGEINFVTQCIDDLSFSDIEYIEKRLKGFGLEVSMTLN